VEEAEEEAEEEEEEEEEEEGVDEDTEAAPDAAGDATADGTTGSGDDVAFAASAVDTGKEGEGAVSAAGSAIAPANSPSIWMRK
jgi:hypothetical protein